MLLLCLTHTQYTPFLYDYVLVAKTVANQEREAFKKQMEYIEELKKKNIKITVGADKDSAIIVKVLMVNLP